MKLQKLAVTILALLMIMGIASQTKGEISEAALLYLRIAPGARAAGMGEAYVAISDDATSTHWNPAGLASTALSGSWQDVSVPQQYRPILKSAAVHSRGGNSYTAYDLWMLTAQGLVRYDNKSWYDYEEFDTKTDQTVRDIISSYFNIEDEERLQVVVNKVASQVNQKSYEWLSEFTQNITENIPVGYSDADGLKAGLDSLLSGYELCLLNWARINEAEKKFLDGLKEGGLSEREMDQVNFAIEKGRGRFIPEELKIGYTALFDSAPTMIAGANKSLIVASEKSCYYFNGRSWENISLTDDLEVETIYSVESNNTNFYFGTNKGVIKFNGTTFINLDGEGFLPEGNVTAIGVSSSVDVWVMIDGRLFNFNGSNWDEGRFYTTAIDDTPEKIAEKFALYNTPTEKEKFIALLKEINNPARFVKAETDKESEPADIANDTTTRLTDVIKQAETEADSFEGFEITSADQQLEPQTKLIVPYVAMIKGKVSTLMANLRKEIWIGTDLGVVYFNGKNWALPGYKKHEVLPGQTIDSVLAANPTTKLDNVTYTKVVKTINDIDGDNLVAGQKVWVYRNSTALEVNSITSFGRTVYVATKSGLIKYEAGNWEFVGTSRIGRGNVIDVLTPSNKLWFVSSQKVLTKADGHSDISMMVAKWLPQLASDMYYFFLSGATHVDGLGTLGCNFTFISYGTIQRRGENNEDLGSFEPYDVTFTGSYGRPITDKLKVGLSFKFIYSHLTEIGAGIEVGEGTATAWGADIGLMYQLTDRLNLGAAFTNIGPNISYVDASQSDPIPRNLAVGFAYKLFTSQYYNALVTLEGNKSMVGSNNGFSEELKEVIINGGFEFAYTTLFAVRAGYIYDQEGDVKTPTLGVGLQPLDLFRFDFAYIPSSDDTPLSNTLRISMQIKI